MQEQNGGVPPQEHYTDRYQAAEPIRSAWSEGNTATVVRGGTSIVRESWWSASR